MKIRIKEKLRNEFVKAKKTLLEAQRVCIVSHRGPDGDAVGTNLALRLALEALGKQVTSACVDKVPDNSIWLKGGGDYLLDFEYEDFDVIVAVDCAALKLFRFHEQKPEILNGPKPFVNFDHHDSNNSYGTINPVDPEACAAAFIMYQFLVFAGWEITPEIATCLLHGIYFDTGGLMHSNTTVEVFRVAGDLVARGANLQRISKELFHTTPVNRLRLWGRIMERAYVNENNVTVSAVGNEDYRACNIESKDTSGIIDYLNAVPGSDYCLLLSEGQEGTVKGSLRTQRDDINLSDVAAQWGGGGHPKASGFSVEGKLRPVTHWIVDGEQGLEF